MNNEGEPSALLAARAATVKLVITDVDGVLTDTGVYYSDAGEVLKRFSIRDGMGVERLRTAACIETGIVSGEESPSIQARARKLGISEVHLGIKNKERLIPAICARRAITPQEIAYIGDDVNDLSIMEAVGLSGCPADAVREVRNRADFVCQNRGGHGAFREFADFILSSLESQRRQKQKEEKNESLQKSQSGQQACRREGARLRYRGDRDKP